MKDNFAYTSYYYMNYDEAHPSKVTYTIVLNGLTNHIDIPVLIIKVGIP
jgi:hypothetical protein